MEFGNRNTDKDTILTLKRWLEAKNRDRSFADYLKECGYLRVGIFDAGEIGRILYDEIKNSGVEVCWFVDKNAEGIAELDGKPVRLMRRVFELPSVDIVIISPIYDYEAVTGFLAEHDPTICTLSLKDAAYEL
ncbi:MAG: hypothetical protein K6E50_00700 [Lachnospiraceae bacterium]|nr:hypothetical protein [Lachnospiraceae bacterium]